MKIRNDFVSNSSSCSFIIEDVKKAAKLFSDAFSNMDIPYNYYSKISVSLAAKNRWYKEIEESLTGSSDYSNTWSDYRDGSIHVKDPEDVGFDRIHIDLNILAEANKHLDKYEKTNKICFECDDYDTLGVDMLKQLYQFFKRNGCRPNDEDTEIDFNNLKSDDFLTKLSTYDIKNIKT